MRQRFGIWILYVLLTAALPAHALDTSLAASVNDEVISRFDVEQRLSLLALSNNLELRSDNTIEIKAQVLRNLIDERLQIQEARRLNIGTTEGELNAAIARLAQQNNSSAEEFEQFIEQRGGSFDSLLDQIKATISWTKVVRQRFGSTVVISPDEAKAEMQKIRERQRVPEFAISEITLPVTTPLDEPAVQALANRLVNEILAGAPFADLARQYSTSASAENGGDLGWRKLDDVPPALVERLRTMQPNQISKPLRTDAGLIIVFLRETRMPGDDALPTIDQQRVTEMLRQRKLEIAARKYLRDLRAQALIEMRN